MKKITYFTLIKILGDRERTEYAYTRAALEQSIADHLDECAGIVTAPCEKVVSVCGYEMMIPDELNTDEMPPEELFMHAVNETFQRFFPIKHLEPTFPANSKQISYEEYYISADDDKESCHNFPVAITSGIDSSYYTASAAKAAGKL